MEDISLINVDFFARDARRVAEALLGKVMSFGACSGLIVETEAYRDDPASHGARNTEKTRLIRESYGRIYVYLVYGMHHCLNFTCEIDAPGAVLVRAIQPIKGMDLMAERRKTSRTIELTNGPGKLCSAFEIDRRLNGARVGEALKIFDATRPTTIRSAPRIGISHARSLPWRFYIADNPFVSRR